MKKLNPKQLFKAIGKSLDKNSPVILAGIGVAGIITTAVLAVKATPKAVKIIEEEKEKRNGEEICVVDKVKLTWKCYIPTAISAVVSGACVIGSTVTSAKKQSALAAACAFTEKTLYDYQEQVKDTIGEKKEQEIRDNICKSQIENDACIPNEICVTGRGTTLCYDSLSGRYFQSDINFIKKIVNDLNREMLIDSLFTTVSLNELYYRIGLPETALGECLGWNAVQGLIEPIFSSQLSENDTPCLVLTFEKMPYGNFNDISI